MSQKYGEAHVYTLEKHDGNGDGATVTTANIKSEWCFATTLPEHALSCIVNGRGIAVANY